VSGVPFPVESGGRLYIVVEDLLAVTSALVTGRVRDVVTGDDLEVGLAAEVDHPHARVATQPGGFYAAVGRADEVFPELAAVSYTLSLTFRARGYRDAAETVIVPMGASLPVVAPPVLLQPVPVRLQGRVVKESDHAPLAASEVSTVTPKMALLRTPLAHAHASGTTVQVRALTPSGAPRTLTEAAPRGALSLRLSSSAGVGPGDVLRLGVAGRSDYAVVQALGPAPGHVTLADPLSRAQPVGGTAQLMALGAPGGSTTLAEGALPGDGLLLLAASLPAGSLEVVDGVHTEYRDVGAIADADGYWSLDGVGGIRTLDLVSRAAGFLDLVAPWPIDYGIPVNVIDFRMRP
jgi:hypothetical protein